MSFEIICSIIGERSRKARTKCIFEYFDGNELKMFEGFLSGNIVEIPSGEKGFGWDKIFISEGYSVTRACLEEADDINTYLQLKPFEQLKKYLQEKRF